MARYRNNNSDGGLIFGIIIICIGILLFMKKAGIFYPNWILSWPMILIAVGVISLIKSEFKSFFGAIMMAVGGYFLLSNQFGFNLGIDRFIFPIGLILLGIYLVTKKKRENQILQDVQEKLKRRSQSRTESTSSFDTESRTEAHSSEQNTFQSFSAGSGTSGATFSDSINIDAILSGVNKRVMTKNMKSAKLTAFMGGVELDLTQADLSGVVTMQIDVIFGGIKLVLPPHWDVRVEVTNIAAGVEDKRKYVQVAIDSEKVLLIRGTVLFGGLEIKSY